MDHPRDVGGVFDELDAISGYYQCALAFAYRVLVCLCGAIVYRNFTAFRETERFQTRYLATI